MVAVVLTCVALTVVVAVTLVLVRNKNTVVLLVGNAVIVIVTIASISEAILETRESVKLVGIWDVWTEIMAEKPLLWHRMVWQPLFM